MNYANAVKRPRTRGFIIDTIRSHADTEFGRDAAVDIVRTLLQRFELDYVYGAIEKVFTQLILTICRLLFNSMDLDR